MQLLPFLRVLQCIETEVSSGGRATIGISHVLHMSVPHCQYYVDMGHKALPDQQSTIYHDQYKNLWIVGHEELPSESTL